MKTEAGAVAVILDYDAATVTTINTAQKSWSVKPLAHVSSAATAAVKGVQIDAKETGNKKTVNGYDASQIVMTMSMQLPQAPQMGNMQVEADTWIPRAFQALKKCASSISGMPRGCRFPRRAATPVSSRRSLSCKNAFIR